MPEHLIVVHEVLGSIPADIGNMGNILDALWQYILDVLRFSCQDFYGQDDS